MTDIPLKKFKIFSFFFIIILGTISHFVYEWSGNNNILAAIFPVNESIWEHLKLFILPSFILLDVEYLLIKDKNNYYFAKFISFVTMIISMISMYYLYTKFLPNNLILNITIFIITVIIGICVEYTIQTSKEKTKSIKILSFVMLWVIFISFVILTYFPLKIEIFRDPVDSGYGIKNN